MGRESYPDFVFAVFQDCEHLMEQSESVYPQSIRPFSYRRVSYVRSQSLDFVLFICFTTCCFCCHAYFKGRPIDFKIRPDSRLETSGILNRKAPLQIPVSVINRVLLGKPLSRIPAAEIALQPLRWCSESLFLCARFRNPQTKNLWVLNSGNSTPSS